LKIQKESDRGEEVEGEVETQDQDIEEEACAPNIRQAQGCEQSRQEGENKAEKAGRQSRARAEALGRAARSTRHGGGNADRAAGIDVSKLKRARLA